MLAVLHARNVADLGAPDFTLEDLLQEWRSSEFELSDDAVVVEDPEGRLIGYAILWIPGALAAVHPAREGEGIDAALLEWCERRARERGRMVHRQWVAERKLAGHELLERYGYHYVRSFWRLECKLDESVRAAPGPPGVVIEPVSVGRDARELYTVSEAAFAESPGFTPESFITFREEHLERHDLSQSLSRVARRDDTVIGFALVRRWEDRVAFIDLLAVDPAEQDRGIGTALLTSTFAACAAAGLRETQLGVASDNAGALRIYERAGMRQRYRGDVFEKPT